MFHQSTPEQGSSNRPGLAAFARVGLLLGCSVVAGGADDPKVPKGPPKVVGKLDVARTVELGAGEAKGFQLAAQPGSQTITVKFSSSKGEVSVYVFPAAEVKGEAGLFTADATKALAGKKAKADGFRVEVAENAEVIVVFRGADEKTAVEVKITNERPDPKDARIKKLEEENAALRKELAELRQQLADLKKQPEKK